MAATAGGSVTDLRLVVLTLSLFACNRVVFDLGSADLVPGEIWTCHEEISILDGELFLRFPGDSMPGAGGEMRAQMMMETMDDYTLEALSSDRHRTTYQSKTTSYRRVVLGETEIEGKDWPLVGEPLIVELVDGRMAVRLETGTPTEAQREALRNLEGTSAVFPDHRVWLGDTWEMGVELSLGIDLFVDSAILGTSGEAVYRAREVSEAADRPCLLVDARTDVTVRVDAGEDFPGIERGVFQFLSEGAACYDLQTGMPLYDSARGWLIVGTEPDPDKGRFVGKVNARSTCGVAALQD